MKSASALESHQCPFCHPERMLLENELNYTIADTSHINTKSALRNARRHPIQTIALSIQGVSVFVH